MLFDHNKYLHLHGKVRKLVKKPPKSPKDVLQCEILVLTELITYISVYRVQFTTS